MNCPKCFEPLRIAERQGVEIDYCPDCRGVWLDQGELDKIIDRTLQYEKPQQSFDDRDRSGFDDRYDKEKYKKKDYKGKDYKHYKKKAKKTKHFIEEIFDIFD